MEEQKILVAIPFEEFARVLRGYDRGETVEVIAEDGPIQVQISTMGWTGGKISLLGYAPHDLAFPYRRIHLWSMDHIYGPEADTIEKSDRPLKLK